MGAKKDAALGKKVHNRDIDRIDELCAIFKSAESTKTQKYKAQAEILNYFDSYLEKYTGLFTGVSLDLMNYDTRGFLGMFLTGRPKSIENLIFQRNYIVHVMSRFDKEDIKSELTVLFLNVLAKYRIVPGVNALNPLTKIFRWRVKDWFNRLVRDPLFKSVETSDISLEDFIDLNNSEEFREEDRCKMDYQWVVEPADSAYAILTRYERYLLSLRFLEEYTIKELADKLQRDKETIKNHLKGALEKLRGVLVDE